VENAAAVGNGSLAGQGGASSGDRRPFSWGGVYNRPVRCAPTLVVLCALAPFPPPSRPPPPISPPQAVDLCARCFHRQRHKKHPFVMRDRLRRPWQPAVRQGDEGGGVPVEFLSLQERELTDADYDLLLSMDARGAPSLPAYLASCLPDATVGARGAGSGGRGNL
jgi:hypothetical protein